MPAPEGVEIWQGDYVDLFLDYRHSHREYIHVIAARNNTRMI